MRPARAASLLGRDGPVERVRVRELRAVWLPRCEAVRLGGVGFSSWCGAHRERKGGGGCSITRADRLAEDSGGQCSACGQRYGPLRPSLEAREPAGLQGDRRLRQVRSGARVPDNRARLHQRTPAPTHRPTIVAGLAEARRGALTRPASWPPCEKAETRQGRAPSTPLSPVATGQSAGRVLRPCAAGAPPGRPYP